MALPVHSGTAAIDLRNSGTYRQDISELLLVSLTPQANLMGAISIGPEFADAQLGWTEDALNQYKITGDTAGSMAATTVTLNVGQTDASVLKTGYLLTPDTTVGGTSEYVEITAINGTALTISRAFKGSATTYASNTVWRVVGAGINPNSDLGPDMSRQRVSKNNYIYRQRLDVNIDSEAIERAKAGSTPGIVDELGYQFQQRLAEWIRLLAQQVYYGYPNGSGNPTNDCQFMYGLTAMLDGTFNANTATTTTAESISDTVLNTMIQSIFKNGGVSRLVGAGVGNSAKLGALYADTMRRDQSDRVRGFYMNVFTPSMANDHVLINDAFINDGAGNGLCLVLDPDRVYLRPFINQGLYTIEAESFRDGDAISILGKWSLEMRNTGSDSSQVHYLHTNLS